MRLAGRRLSRGPTGRGAQQTAEKPLTRQQTLLGRLLIVVAIVLIWQFGPQYTTSVAAFDPFFISSPSAIYSELVVLMFPAQGELSIWPYFAGTLRATGLGAAMGVGLGVSVGLLLSNSRRARQLISPFLHTVNSLPKIALIPIIIIIFGPSTSATVAVSALIVFFTVVYNAQAGGRSVPLESIENARMMGSTRFGLLRHLRFKYALMWTFAALPNAISHGLNGVVVAEILSGSGGLGFLIVHSLAQTNSTLTFSIVVVLGVLGALLVALAEVLRSRLLHWAPEVLEEAR